MRYESMPRMSPNSSDQRRASTVHCVNKAVHKGHWNMQLISSYRPWSHFIEFSFDFFPQVIYWIQIRTESRSWHDSDVALLEKVPACGHCPAGTCDACDGHTRVQCEVEGPDWNTAEPWCHYLYLVQYSERYQVQLYDWSRWLLCPPQWVSLHHICVTFTSSSPDPYSVIRRRNTSCWRRIKRGVVTRAWLVRERSLVLLVVLYRCYGW